MKANQLNQNAATLTLEMSWLDQVIQRRLKLFFELDNNSTELVPPDLTLDTSNYAQTVLGRRLNEIERLVLALAMAPHILPQIFDCFSMKNLNLDAAYTEFGGSKNNEYGGFIPTGQTAAFILGPRDIQRRFELMKTLSEGQLLTGNQPLLERQQISHAPLLAEPFLVSTSYLNHFTLG